MARIKVIQLTEQQRLQLEAGFRSASVRTHLLYLTMQAYTDTNSRGNFAQYGRSAVCSSFSFRHTAHLNIVEMLWRILKGEWLRPVDYVSTDSLLYATNR